jgi:hypothetical protein
MKYKLVPQPEDSWEDNPCWDCVFGHEDGECHAPKEICESEDGDKCGFKWKGTQYIFIESDED